jgi:hypothetical protein
MLWVHKPRSLLVRSIELLYLAVSREVKYLLMSFIILYQVIAKYYTHYHDLC